MSVLRCCRWGLAGAILALPAAGQQPPSLVQDLLGDVREVHEKLVALAREFPADKYGWRPSDGVRSVGEVFLHVAADNYLIPAALGTPPPASTGLVATDYSTGLAFERRTLGKDAILQELERSFAHLTQLLDKTTATQLAQEFSMFGRRFTGQQVWVLTVTHIHEHLGQMIAYARSNGIVPPWSRGGM